MTPELARAIYFAGQQAVVTHLCGLHEQVLALQHKVKEQEQRIARLSKNSSSSSKPPSSDITKPKNTPARSKEKRKIGGQPGHPKHTHPPYPPEAIDELHEYASCYMKNVCHASLSTIRKFIRDVLGEKVSRGYLVKLIQKVSLSLAWISTAGNSPNTCAAEAGGQALRRSGRPFHQGTWTGWSSRPEAITIGKWARRWKRTSTCCSVMWTSAGMSMRSRKTCRAWASA